MEEVVHKLVNRHYIDHGHGLIRLSRINQVEVDDVVTLNMVDKEVVDGILVRRSDTL